MRTKQLGAIVVFLMALALISMTLVGRRHQSPTSPQLVSLPSPTAHAAELWPSTDRDIQPEPPTIDLPRGQKFVGFAPDMKIGVIQFQCLKAKNRLKGEAPRHLTFYGRPTENGPKQVLFHIQEH